MNTSLRIALVLNPFTLRRKGGEHAPCISRELLGRGHRVRVFGDVAGDVPHSRTPGEDEGIAPLDGTGLRDFAPDVIVAYDGLSPAAWRGARASASLDVPLVLVEEGLPDRGRAIERLLRAFGARAWGRLVRRQARRVVALDPVAVARAQREGFRPEIVTELRAGVDIHSFRPGLHSALIGQPSVGQHVLLFIGRLEPDRGLEVLVDVFARTVGQVSGWTLALAATGSYRTRIRAQVERLGISARVHWLGVPRAEELPGLLAGATALLVPALDDDVASLKIRRAMAAGIPVLVSDVARLRGTVDHDETGLVVPAGDRAAWIEAVQRLASDPNRRARWGSRARQVAVDSLSWEHVAERFEKVLHDAVSGHEAERERAAADAAEDEAGAQPA
ncbi:MAG: glycosyltransferase family 4 protein [Planctomycetota bacterium]